MNKIDEILIDAFAQEETETLVDVIELIQKAINKKNQLSVEKGLVIHHMFNHGPITDMNPVHSVDLLDEMETEGLLWSIDHDNVRYYSYTDQGLIKYIEGAFEA